MKLVSIPFFFREKKQFQNIKIIGKATELDRQENRIFTVIRSKHKNKDMQATDLHFEWPLILM